MAAPALFLDRDGVINEEVHFLHTIAGFRLLPGVLETCRLFREAGFRLVVITNQSGIARGHFSEEQYWRLTRWMETLFREAGVPLDGVYHCPHHPTRGQGAYLRACDCRKPLPGMLLQARDQLDLDLSRSLLVGDKGSDLQAGRNAGVARVILSRSGHPVSNADCAAADHVVDGLHDHAFFHALLAELTAPTPAG